MHYSVGVMSRGSALFVSEGLLKAQLRAGPSALVLFVGGDQALVRRYQEDGEA